MRKLEYCKLQYYNSIRFNVTHNFEYINDNFMTNNTILIICRKKG